MEPQVPAAAQRRSVPSPGSRLAQALEQQESSTPAAEHFSPAALQVLAAGLAHRLLSQRREQQASGEAELQASPTCLHNPVAHLPETQLSEQQVRAKAQSAPTSSHRPGPLPATQTESVQWPLQHSAALRQPAPLPRQIVEPPSPTSAVAQRPPVQLPLQHWAGEVQA